MKNTFRIFLFAAFAMIYSLISGIHNSHVPTSQNTSNIALQITKGEHVNGFFHTPQSQTTVSNCNRFQVHAFKKLVNEFTRPSKWKNTRLRAIFTQIEYKAHFAAVRLMSTDVIFPFHYFL